MSRRWKCPRCDGGLLAPGRMRKDDARRFCLPCTGETGRLVERVAPALERKRERSAARTTERRRSERERARSAWTLDDGTDMKAVVRRARRLKVWEVQTGEQLRARRARVDVVIGEPRANHGRAFGSRRAHVHLRRDQPGWDAILLVLHEMTHLVLDKTRLEKRHGPHGRNFHMVLLEAALEWWPDLRAVEADIMRAYVHVGGAGSAYSMDRAIEAWLPTVLLAKEAR